MFLFTTSSTREAAPANPVVDAIRYGSESTGVSFDYLLATAQRESALDPKAQAPSSSASGLFQFVEQTWLGLVKTDGAKLGLGDYAGAITTRSDGTLTVADPAMRRTILGLRDDPKVASVMAGVFTQRNRDMLAAELGREPTGGDLAVAHFLGARGAADLIRTAQQTPQRSAAAQFPDAAAANRGIFYDRSGRARGAGEVYGLLAASQSAQTVADAAPAFAPDKPLSFAAQDGPALYDLFQTDSRRGPMSEAVAKLWRTGADAGPRAAALTGYFPRSSETEASSEVVDAAPAETPAAAMPASLMPAATPLPPARPAEGGTVPARHGRAARTNAPLDLGSFMKRRKA